MILKDLDTQVLIRSPEDPNSLIFRILILNSKKRLRILCYWKIIRSNFYLNQGF